MGPVHSRLPAAASGTIAILVLLLSAVAPTFARAQDRPWIVDQIERGFNGFFLLTTNGDGNYDIYQRVEDGLGISPGANVVCMMRACFLEVGPVPEASLAKFNGGHGNAGELRRRFGAVRDTYEAMRAATREERPAAVDAWHTAMDHLSECLRTIDQCR